MTFKAEVRLIRWAESSTAGRTITIELPPGDGEVHPFRGFQVGHAHGQRFKMAFVPIDDDETEIPDPVADVNRSPDGPPQDQPIVARTPRPAEGVNSRSAIGRKRYRDANNPKRAFVRSVRLPRNEKFREWAQVDNEAQAVAFIRDAIGGSRSLIDEDDEFYERYMTMETSYLMETGQMAHPR